MVSLGYLSQQFILICQSCLDQSEEQSWGYNNIMQLTKKTYLGHVASVGSTQQQQNSKTLANSTEREQLTEPCVIYAKLAITQLIASGLIGLCKWRPPQTGKPGTTPAKARSKGHTRWVVDGAMPWLHKSSRHLSCRQSGYFFIWW